MSNENKALHEEMIERATQAARECGHPVVVVHAPIENAEEESVYGFCPEMAAPILFRHALKGLGQRDEPARGIVARISPDGKVVRL